MQILFCHLVVELCHRVHYVEVFEGHRLVLLSGEVSRHLFVLEEGLLGATLLELGRGVVVELGLGFGLAFGFRGQVCLEGAVEAIGSLVEDLGLG